MNDIIKIVKSLEESDLLITGVSKTIKNETKEQKGRSDLTLLGILAANISGTALTGREVTRAGENF